MPKKLSTEQWIAKANQTHGNFYSYRKTVYESAKIKVVITCPIHGDFAQTPDSHARGNGCSECKRQTLANLRQKNLMDFLDSAKKVHGDLYDYSRTVYNGAKSNLRISCRLHGEFEQLATNHLSGSGCYDCGRRKTTEARKITKTAFVERANKMHGNIYNYSKTVISGASQKCDIHCEEHGMFSQTPASHMAGNGCPKCAAKRISIFRLGSIEDFTSKAEVIHCGEYDYSRSVYISARNKLEIVCRQHGSFLQTPNDHLSGKGCSACGKYGFQHTKPALFYYVRINRDAQSPLWMVGITNRSFEERYPASDRKLMSLLSIEYFESGANALEFEALVLRANKSKLYKGRSPLKSKGMGSGISKEIFTADILGLDV